MISPHKPGAQSDQPLSEGEQHYHLIADFTPDWEYWLGNDGALLYVSPACERITGYPPSAFMADSDLLIKIVHPEDRQLIELHLADLAAPGDSAPIDFRIIRRDGEERWIGHVCQPVFDEQGNRQGQRASNRDITDRKRAEAELTRANRFITSLALVAARIESTRDPDSLMSTMGGELKRLGINCMVFTYDARAALLAPRYISLESDLLAHAETWAGLKLRDIHFPSNILSFFPEIIERRKTFFSGDSLPTATTIMSRVPPHIVQHILRLVGFTERTRLIHAPLIANDCVIGTLALWGDELRESDCPVITLFASQVAIAIENARLYSELQQQSITDSLTGIYNRRGLFELGHREVDRSQRFGRPLTALMIDIDHFKRVNDEHSHAIGDEVLRAIARRCAQNIRDIDILGRYGGEEFVILLPENDLPTARQVAERVRQSIADSPVATSARAIHATVSIGLVELTAHAPNLDTLIHAADAAMYRAKQQGRNRVATNFPHE